jgi:putative membrane protein
MIIELIIALTIGILVGVITGLTPGIHINLIASALLISSPFLLLIFPPLSLVIFIISMTITHIFIDFIPSIYLGAPDESSSLSILPGHELLIQGRGYEALILSVFGALIGIILFLPLIPSFIFLLPIIYPYIQNIIPVILLIILATMLLFEKNKKLPALIILLLSSFLGIAALNLNLKEPLLPLLTGLFGASSLITSITKKQKLPHQEIYPLKIILMNLKKSSVTKSITSSLIASPLCSFLPGLGSSQAATIGSYVTGELDEKEFLILLGIVNSLVMSLSFITLFSINKVRTGSAAAISKLIPVLSSQDLIYVISSIMLSAIFSFIISIQIAKIFSKLISKINYNFLSLIILIFLTIIVFIFSNFMGILVYTTSTALGITCILLGVKRTTLMSCLIVPTIILYIF